MGPLRLLSAWLEDGTTLGTVAGQLSSHPMMDDILLKTDSRKCLNHGAVSTSLQLGRKVKRKSLVSQRYLKTMAINHD